MLYLVLLIINIYFINLNSAWKDFNTLQTEQPTRKSVISENILKKTCLLKADHGPCRAGIPMYYFDKSTMNCTEFHWGGCQGNGNRFKHYGDCMDFCVSKDDWKPGRPRWCALTFDYGYCFGGESRYYYDRLYKVCKETIYSGCGGNKNNFYNKEQCDQVCRFGNPPLADPYWKRKRHGLKKILIVNPWNGSIKKTTKKTKATATNTQRTSTTQSEMPVDDITTAAATKKSDASTTGTTTAAAVRAGSEATTSAASEAATPAPAPETSPPDTPTGGGDKAI